MSSGQSFAVDRAGRSVLMPEDQMTARVVRATVGEVHCRWCDDLLVWAIGEELAPHFRHRPGHWCREGEEPVLRDTETHRLIQQLLGDWCDRQGFEWRAEVIVIGEQARTDFQFDATGVVGRIEVQRSPLGPKAWAERTHRYEKDVSFVTWIFEDPGISAAIEAGMQSPTLAYRLIPAHDGLELAGAFAGQVRTEWIPLDDWAVKEDRGLWHPILDSVQRPLLHTSPTEYARQYWRKVGLRPPTYRR